MKYDYWDIFEDVDGDNRLTPKMPININGIILTQGVTFSRGVTWGGVDFFDYWGVPIEAEEINGILVIRGFYSS